MPSYYRSFTFFHLYRLMPGGNCFVTTNISKHVDDSIKCLIVLMFERTYRFQHENIRTYTRTRYNINLRVYIYSISIYHKIRVKWTIPTRVWKPLNCIIYIFLRFFFTSLSSFEYMYMKKKKKNQREKNTMLSECKSYFIFITSKCHNRTLHFESYYQMYVKNIT